MLRVWNIGNTTVRNPKRIENALMVFVEEGFSGNAKGKDQEERLLNKLRENRVVEFEGEPSAWNGRKWRAAFYQLGFISYEKYLIDKVTFSAEEFFKKINCSKISFPYQITPAGKKLISTDRIAEIEEIYTRQLLCYELPNSLERRFDNGPLKPFILFLQVLQLLRSKNLDGLSKLEVGLFLQRFYTHSPDLAENIVKNLLAFRHDLSSCKNSNERKAIKKKYVESLRKEITIDPQSVVSDYSDTTFRYFLLTGLFSRKGETISIRDSKVEFVNYLLESEPVFTFNTNPYEYFSNFYNCSYPLPIDDIEFSFKEVQRLKSGVKDKRHELFKRAETITLDSGMKEINDLRLDLIEYNNWEREVDFASQQQSIKSVNEILEYLAILNNEKPTGHLEIDDRPAYLEWAVWRSFLAINEIICPVHETRRFPVDYDFFPRNTAPGGGSDLIFVFKNYILVVEVTLTSSSRQMAVESEPVRRHTVQYQNIFKDKTVYCLFVAPSIDNNVVETFRIGVWYKNDEEEFVNILPMELGDFINLFEIFRYKKFTNDDLKSLMDRCLVFRNARAPLWKRKISLEIKEWKNSFLKE